MIAVAPYSNRPLRRLLHEYKYNGVQEAREAVLGLFGSFLACHVPLLESRRPQAVIAVPMHYLREAGRGFNQALELAAVTSGQLDLPCCARGLGRRWSFRRQAEIEGQKERRRRNAAGTVYEREPLGHLGCVILVDDVVTTGATLSETASVLRRAGVREVHAVTFLRG